MAKKKRTLSPVFSAKADCFSAN